MGDAHHEPGNGEGPAVGGLPGPPVGYQIHQLALHLGQAELLVVADPGTGALVPAQCVAVGHEHGTECVGAVPELLILGSHRLKDSSKPPVAAKKSADTPRLPLVTALKMFSSPL